MKTFNTISDNFRILDDGAGIASTPRIIMLKDRNRGLYIRGTDLSTLDMPLNWIFASVLPIDRDAMGSGL